MKKLIIVCLIVNIFIYTTFIYFIFSNNKKDEILRMYDVINLNKDEALEELKEFKITIIEENSTKDIGTVLYSVPKANDLVYKGQEIKLYVSTGYKDVQYNNLVHKYYETTVDYLNKIESEYNLNLIIENQISDDYADGLIIYQSSNGNINNNDTFKIIVNYNKPLILIPDLIGKTEFEVKKCFENLDITLIFVYEKKNDYKNVFKQSIEKDKLVISNTILYVYIAI